MRINMRQYAWQIPQNKQLEIDEYLQKISCNGQSASSPSPIQKSRLLYEAME